jgi:hypothetical protein
LKRRETEALQHKSTAAASSSLLPDEGFDLEGPLKRVIRQAFCIAGGNEMKAAKLL